MTRGTDFLRIFYFFTGIAICREGSSGVSREEDKGKDEVVFRGLEYHMDDEEGGALQKDLSQK